MSEDVKQAIANVSNAIRKTIAIVRSEEDHPSFDADRSDDVIRDGKERIAKLREIRQQLEDL